MDLVLGEPDLEEFFMMMQAQEAGCMDQCPVDPDPFGLIGQVPASSPCLGSDMPAAYHLPQDAYCGNDGAMPLGSPSSEDCQDSVMSDALASPVVALHHQQPVCGSPAMYRSSSNGVSSDSTFSNNAMGLASEALDVTSQPQCPVPAPASLAGAEQLLSAFRRRNALSQVKLQQEQQQVSPFAATSLPPTPMPSAPALPTPSGCAPAPELPACLPAPSMASQLPSQPSCPMPLTPHLQPATSLPMPKACMLTHSSSSNLLSALPQQQLPVPAPAPAAPQQPAPAVSCPPTPRTASATTTAAPAAPVPAPAPAPATAIRIKQEPADSATDDLDDDALLLKQEPGSNSNSCGASKVPISHSTVEKQRRDRLNTLIEVLADLVPASDPKYRVDGPGESSGVRRPKHLILSDTINTIKRLQDKLSVYELQQQQQASAGPAKLAKQHSSAASDICTFLAASSPASTDDYYPDGATALMGASGTITTSSAPLTPPEMPLPIDGMSRMTGVTVEMHGDCAWLLRVSCRDRKNLLGDICEALRPLPLQIVSASITTAADGKVQDVFEVLVQDGRLQAEEVQCAVTAALYNHMSAGVAGAAGGARETRAAKRARQE